MNNRIEGIGNNFSIGQLISGFTNSRTGAERDEALAAGLSGHIPEEGEMIKRWSKPFLFFRFVMLALVLAVIICISVIVYGNHETRGILISIIPFLMPLTIMIFLWEMNIPRNISIFEMLFVAFFGGVLCVLVTSFITDIAGTGSSDVFSPIPQEFGKLLLVAYFVRKRRTCYGLNGIAVGAAIGTGFAACETLGATMQGISDYGDISNGPLVLGVFLLGLLTVGTHVVWTATYAGALVLSKKNAFLSGNHFLDPLFVISWCSSFLLHILWKCDIESFFDRFADSEPMMTLKRILVNYHLFHVMIVVISWAILMTVMKKSLAQAAQIAAQASGFELAAKQAAASAVKSETVFSIVGVSGVFAGKEFKVEPGRTLALGRSGANQISFPETTQGISGKHCEVRCAGNMLSLKDVGSSYGTFSGSGAKLEARTEYKLREGESFYLASPDQKFTVKKTTIQKAAPQVNVPKKSFRPDDALGNADDPKAIAIIITVFLLIMIAFVAVAKGSGLGRGGSDVSGEAITRGIDGVWYSDKDLMGILADKVGIDIGSGSSEIAFANGDVLIGDGLSFGKLTYADLGDGNITFLLQCDIGITTNLSYNGTYHMLSNDSAQVDFFGVTLNLTRK